MQDTSDGMKYLRLCAWGCVGFLAFCLLWHSWYGPDIWYHLYLGRRILETGVTQPTDNLLLKQPFNFNLYWIYELIVYPLFKLGGRGLVTGFFMLLWTAILTLWYRAAGIKRWDWAAVPVTLFAILVFKHRFEERPEIFSFLFMMIHVTTYQKWDTSRPLSRKQWAVLTLTQLLWANIHGFFIFGPAIAGLRALTLLFDKNSSKAAIKSAALLTAVLIALSLVSPLGIKNFIYFLNAMGFMSGMNHDIQELNPPTGMLLFRFWTLWFFWAAWAATLAATYWEITGRPRDYFPPALSAVGLYLSATAYRNVPLVFLFSAPLYFDLYARLPFARITRYTRAAAALSAIFALWLAFFHVSGRYFESLGSPAVFGTSISPVHYPLWFDNYLSRVDFKGSMFNCADGSYLEFHYPDIKLYVDSRMIDSQLIPEYFNACAQPDMFHKLDNEYKFDTAILDLTHGPDVIVDLMRSPDWKMAYADLHFAFFKHVKRGGKDLPVWPPKFYDGQDLHFVPYGFMSFTWMNVLVSYHDRGLFLEGLRQFMQAPAVPTPLVRAALFYAHKESDPQVANLGFQLLPKVYVHTPEDAHVLQALSQDEGLSELAKKWSPGKQ